MITTDAFTKTIRYDRETRDYRMELDGELIGFARTYHEAEVTLDELVHEILTRTTVETADIAAEAAPVCAICNGEGRVPNGNGTGELCGGWADVCECVEVTTCEARDCTAPATHTIATTDPVTHTCCFHYSEEFTGQLCPCRTDPPADPDPGPDPWPSIFRPVVAPALLAEADAVLIADGCAACGGAHHIQACPAIRAQLFTPATAHVPADPAPSCLACGRTHSTYICPEIGKLLRPTDARWLADVLIGRFLEAA